MKNFQGNFERWIYTYRIFSAFSRILCQPSIFRLTGYNLAHLQHSSTILRHSANWNGIETKHDQVTRWFADETKSKEKAPTRGEFGRIILTFKTLHWLLNLATSHGFFFWQRNLHFQEMYPHLCDVVCLLMAQIQLSDDGICS